MPDAARMRETQNEDFSRRNVQRFAHKFLMKHNFREITACTVFLLFSFPRHSFIRIWNRLLWPCIESCTKNCDRAKRGAAISAISVCTVHNTKRQKIKTFSFTLILCSLFFHPFSDSMTLTLCLFFFLLLNSVALARQFARSFSAFSSAFHGVCKRCH